MKRLLLAIPLLLIGLVGCNTPDEIKQCHAQQGNEMVSNLRLVGTLPNGTQVYSTHLTEKTEDETFSHYIYFSIDPHGKVDTTKNVKSGDNEDPKFRTTATLAAQAEQARLLAEQAKAVEIEALKKRLTELEQAK